MNLQSLIARFDQNFEAIANTSLAIAADELAREVRLALSVSPGGPHDHPWMQTGALHDSVEARAEGAQAVVGSTSDVAVYQEHGTATVPPRPTFAPIAASTGHALAQSMGHSVARALGST